MNKTIATFALLSLSLIAFVGCGSGGDQIVAQPEKSAAELQAEQEAYEAQMSADAASSGYQR